MANICVLLKIVAKGFESLLSDRISFESLLGKLVRLS